MMVNVYNELVKCDTGDDKPLDLSNKSPTSHSNQANQEAYNCGMKSENKLILVACLDVPGPSQCAHREANSSNNNRILSEISNSHNSRRRKQILIPRQQYTNESEDDNCIPLDLRRKKPAYSHTKKRRPRVKNPTIESDNKLKSVDQSGFMDNLEPKNHLPITSNKTNNLQPIILDTPQRSIFCLQKIKSSNRKSKKPSECLSKPVSNRNSREDLDNLFERLAKAKTPQPKTYAKIQLPSKQGQSKMNDGTKVQPIKVISKITVNKFNDDYLVDPVTGYRHRRTDLNKKISNSRRIIKINTEDKLINRQTQVKEDINKSQITIPRRSDRIKKSSKCKSLSAPRCCAEWNAELEPSSNISPTITVTPIAADLHPAPKSSLEEEFSFILLQSLFSIQPIHTVATNCEKFEDARELIAEDVNNMEVTAEENNTQCFLCAWRCSKLNYEDHLRQSHSDLIETYKTELWTVKFSLGSLFDSFTWVHKIIEYKSALYIMNVKYKVDEDSILAMVYGILHNESLSFNCVQITNETDQCEPYLWKGYIKEYANEIPDIINTDCYKNELSNIKLPPVPKNLLVKRLSDSLLEEHFNFPNLDLYDIVLNVQLYNNLI